MADTKISALTEDTAPARAAVIPIVTGGLNKKSQLGNLPGSTAVSAPSSGTTMTPNADTADLSSIVCTESTGTLTIGAPSGSPTDGQLLILRIECTNAQTGSWNAAYRAAATTPGALPTTGAFAAGKINYFAFRYHSGDTVWDYVGFSGPFTAT